MQLWDLEAASCSKEIETPSQYRGYKFGGFDVLENKGVAVVGYNPPFDGNTIATYNFATDQWKEVRDLIHSERIGHLYIETHSLLLRSAKEGYF